MPEMKWYAIHTFSGQENNIKKRIEQMIEREGVQEKFGRILLPTREVVSTVRGHRHVSVQNAMPTYVFIEMVLDELTQHLVMNINGVTHFLGMTPTKRVAIPLQQSEVDRLLGVDPSGSAEGEIQNPYSIGENVRIKEGPFTDFNGRVEEVMYDKARLRCFVSIFGRETSVELGFNEVEKI